MPTGCIHYHRAIAPLSFDDAAMDALIDDFQKTPDIRNNSSDTSKFFQLIRPNFKHLRREIVELVEKTEIYVVPQKSCVAFTQLGDNGSPQIVICSGYIALIEACIFNARLESDIPDTLKHLPVGPEELTLIHALNGAASTLIYRFYRYGEPLPNFREALSPERADTAISGSIAGALTFTLLHEIGHIFYHHLTRTAHGITQYNKIYSQPLSDHQLQEVEADRFALQSFTEKAKELGPLWMQASLSPWVTLELMSGYLTDTHPLAINRINTAENTGANILTQYGIPLKAADYARVYGSVHKYGPPGVVPLMDIPRRECLATLEEITQVLALFKVDISALLSEILI